MATDRSRPALSDGLAPVNPADAPAYSRPVCAPLGYGLVALCAGWLAHGVITADWQQFPLTLLPIGLSLLVATPVWIMADLLIATLSVDAQTLRRQGLGRRPTVITWTQVRHIKLHSGRGTQRSLIVYAPHAKIALSNTRRDFWPIAHQILHTADAHQIPVKVDGLSSRESWLWGERG